MSGDNLGDLLQGLALIEPWSWSDDATELIIDGVGSDRDTASGMVCR